MTPLLSLWLPILLSAIVVFFVSSIIHMVMPWHKSDYPRLPDQDRFMDAVRPFAIPPGDYMVPRCETRAELKTPEFLDKMKKGPVIVMTVLPNGEWTMGQNLALWFLYALVVGVFAAYIAAHALAPGAPYLSVFRFVGATMFLGYSLALWQMSIWYKRSWLTTFKANVDGLIYALLSAGIFGWLWPKA